MLGGEAERRRVRVEHARIGQERDARALGRRDRVAVLECPSAQGVGRDQQHPADPGHGGIQRVDALVVPDPDRDAAVREGRARARIADQHGDALGRQAAEQGIDHSPAQLAGSAGDEVKGAAHVTSSSVSD